MSVTASGSRRPSILRAFAPSRETSLSCLAVFRHILGCAASILLFTSSALACGIGWRFSRFGHFDGVNNYGYVEFLEPLGDLILGDGSKIALHAMFNSKWDRPSPYLGYGWSLPLLESRMVQSDENTFNFFMPNGEERTFVRNKTVPTVLESHGGWKAEIKGDMILVESDCGTRISLSRGRVISIAMKEGRLDYVWDGDQVSEIREGGRTLMKVERDGSGAVVGIQLAERGRIAIGMGKRPRIDALADRFVVGAVESSLTEIRRADGSVVSFSHEADKDLVPGIKMGNRLITWNPVDRLVRQDAGWQYRIVPDTNPSNYARIERKWGTTGYEYWHDDIARGVRTEVSEDGVKLVRTHFVSGPLAGKLRSLVKTKDGKETVIERYAYDDKKRVVREVREGVGTRKFAHDDKAGTETAIDESTGGALWVKTLSEDGNLAQIDYADGRKLKLDYREKPKVRATLSRAGRQVTAEWNTGSMIPGLIFSNPKQMQTIAQ